MRRSDRDSSGDVMQKRGRAADQRFLMKARGDRFQLPKYFYFFHILGIIIPTDTYFSKGLKPPTSECWGGPLPENPPTPPHPPRQVTAFQPSAQPTIPTELRRFSSLAARFQYGKGHQTGAAGDSQKSPLVNW